MWRVWKSADIVLKDGGVATNKSVLIILGKGYNHVSQSAVDFA